MRVAVAAGVVGNSYYRRSVVAVSRLALLVLLSLRVGLLQTTAGVCVLAAGKEAHEQRFARWFGRRARKHCKPHDCGGFVFVWRLILWGYDQLSGLACVLAIG